MKHRDHSSVK